MALGSASAPWGLITQAFLNIQSKNQTTNPSYIAGFVICLTNTMSTARMRILQPLILMMDIPLGMRQIDSPEGSGYYSKSAPATILNSFRIINSTSHYCFYNTLIRKARGQVTVASLFTDIMTNHCSSRWKQYSPRVKAEFSVISAASDAPYSLFKLQQLRIRRLGSETR